jgi:RNA polymerase sigma-70 factor, ECF subfamily
MEWAPEHSAEETTEILLRWAGGDAAALEQLMPRVYHELRRLAHSYAANSNTLQPTVLVHELYVRLINASRVNVRDRSHFLAIAAKAMRRISIDGIRASAAQKRGGDLKMAAFATDLAAAAPDETMIRLNDALDDLEKSDPRKAAVVEMRFFGGMEMSEVAEALDVSLATAERDWKFARAWLYKTMAGEPA